MKNIIKISVILGGVVIIFLIIGINCYEYIKTNESPLYMTMYKSNTGSVMLLGGMTSDKKKIDSFKRDLEEDECSSYLDESYNYKKQGDYQNAIVQAEEALKLAKTINELWMIRTELADLYEKVGKYSFALNQYDVIIPIQEDASADSKKKGYKLDVERRQKLIATLKASRKRVEELANSSESISSSSKNNSFENIDQKKYESMSFTEQIALLNSWDAKTDFEKLQKKSLLTEAHGDYKNAALLYNELLNSKDMQQDLTPAIHIALQRCYEMLNDTAKESSELIWINDTMLDSKGKFHYMSPYFTDAVKNHLRERIRKYGIKPNW